MKTSKKYLFTLLSIFLLTTSRSVFAQTQPTASSSAAQESIRNNIKERIQKAVGDNPSQATYLALYGQVDSLTQETITLNVDSVPRLIGVTPNTLFENEDSQVDIGDVEIDSPLIAIGSEAENQIISATKIIIPDSPAEPSTKKTLRATISELNTRSEQIITASTSSQPNTILNFTKNTVTHQQGSDQQDSLTFDDFSVGDEIVTIYQPQSKEPSILNILLIHRINTPAQNNEESTSN